jgi:phosphatidate cytidylyltransferase
MAQEPPVASSGGFSPLLVRILVAMALLVILVTAIATGGVVIAVVIGGFVLVATTEFYLITRKMGTPAAPWVLFPLALVFLYRFHLGATASWLVPAALSAAVVLGLAVFLFLPHSEGSLLRWALGLAGALYIGWTVGFYFALYLAHQPDPNRVGLAWLVALAGSTMLGDTAALLTGSKLGRHRFFPRISPKKTVEGAIGGFVVQAITFALLAQLADLPLVHGLVLGALVAVVAQAGDLIESQFKRNAGLKDASGLLPGHGGLLDRMDSLVLIPGVAYYYLALVLHVSLPQ